MSLYNTLFGVNGNAGFLLSVLGLSPGEFERFRDCYFDGENIVVYTRLGGGNREDYQHVFDEMESHPNYIRDEDDDFDSTYCSFFFSIPEDLDDVCKKAVLELVLGEAPQERFKRLLEKMQSAPK